MPLKKGSSHSSASKQHNYKPSKKGAITGGVKAGVRRSKSRKNDENKQSTESLPLSSQDLISINTKSGEAERVALAKKNSYIRVEQDSKKKKKASPLRQS